MKKIFVIMLVLTMAVSLCACADEIMAADGNVIQEPSHGEVVFEHESDAWVITKLEENTYYTKSFGTQYYYSMVISDGEYVCYVEVNRELYAVLNVGDVINGKFVETYYTGYDAPSGKLHFNEKQYSGSCYKLKK